MNNTAMTYQNVQVIQHRVCWSHRKLLPLGHNGLIGPLVPRDVEQGTGQEQESAMGQDVLDVTEIGRSVKTLPAATTWM